MPVDLQTIVDIVQQLRADITAHLYTNSPEINNETTPNDFVPPVFEGYVPQNRLNWRAPETILPTRSFAISARVSWTRFAGVGPEDIRGVILTYPHTPNQVRLLGQVPFDPPVVISKDGQTLSVKLAFHVRQLPTRSVYEEIVQFDAVEDVAIARGQMMELRGNDRRTAGCALQFLNAMRQRDVEVDSLSPQSLRSRVKFVSEEDDELNAAVELVAARLGTMLKL